MNLSGTLADDAEYYALTVVAQGTGAIKQGRVALEETAGEWRLDGQHLAFDEAVKLIAPEETPLGNQEALAKVKQANFSVDLALAEELASIVGHGGLFSGKPDEKLSIADLIVYAAMRTFISTSTPQDKARLRDVMGWYSKVGKTEFMKKEKPAPRPDDDAARFKLVVGRVIEVWHHPEADGLYCEKIDLGEEEPRQIATGIRKYYPQDKFENSLVVVLANMKPKALRGFSSCGMVMCASNEEHTIVQPIRPPEDSKPGDRVTFDGYVGGGEPDVALNAKVLGAVLGHLHTDGSCAAHYKNFKWIVNGKELKSETLADCHIS